jgi:hypothetical protein
MRSLFLTCLVAVVGATHLAAAQSTPPTFNRDVLPILQQNCQNCHRPGEIGPMPLLTYEQTRPWAKAIKNEVLMRRMPPWYADPQFGHFTNDRRLSDENIRKLVAWVDAGAPEGNVKDKPTPRVWRDGWNVRPDKIFQMSQPYVVPAKGILDYIYIVLPTGFTRDTWVTAAEVRPVARDVVHHILAVIRPPGSQWMKDAKPFVPYFPPPEDNNAPGNNPQTQPVNMNFEYLAGYSPGMQAERFDVSQSAKLIPAGSDIVLQVHYTPNGRSAAQDLTKVGVTLATATPKKRFMSAVAASAKWEIAPGDPNAEGKATLIFGEPVELVSIQPHMHVRGKDMTIRAIYPGGQSQVLLSVPRYDFRWQIIYYLAKPLALPQGTKIEVTGHWDNSANNPFNPDPTATVRYGFQSSEEMLSAAMGVVIEP